MRFLDVSDAQWRVLASQRIYFAHQSVGANILDGVQELLAAHPSIGLREVESSTLSTSAAPGLYHARVGRNGDPLSKSAELVRMAGAGLPSVAMVKYCYADVEGSTNPESLFTQYRRQMNELRSAHPAVTIVHITMPLTTIGGRKEWLGGMVRGTPTSRDLNLVRNRYNDRMRETFAGREPLFDLAAVESTRPDGSRVFFERAGTPVYYLAPEYTNDGGHLIGAGRRSAAEALLATLAGIQK